jgi:hypothetical protein
MSVHQSTSKLSRARIGRRLHCMRGDARRACIESVANYRRAGAPVHRRISPVDSGYRGDPVWCTKTLEGSRKDGCVAAWRTPRIPFMSVNGGQMPGPPYDAWCLKRENSIERLE